MGCLPVTSGGSGKNASMKIVSGIAPDMRSPLSPAASPVATPARHRGAPAPGVGDLKARPSGPAISSRQDDANTAAVAVGATRSRANCDPDRAPLPLRLPSIIGLRTVTVTAIALLARPLGVVVHASGPADGSRNLVGLVPGTMRARTTKTCPATVSRRARARTAINAVTATLRLRPLPRRRLPPRPQCLRTLHRPRNRLRLSPVPSLR